MLGAAAGFDGNDPASLTASVPDYLANLDAGRIPIVRIIWDGLRANSLSTTG